MPRDAGDISRTFGKLVEGETQRRHALATIDDPRRPKQRSPVIVQIVWDGEDPLEPFHAVKLGAVVFDPASNPAAPYKALTFHATAFAAMDSTKAYGFALDRIPGGGEGVGFAVIPEAAWTKINVTNDTHAFAKIIAGGTLFDSHASEGLPIHWKESGTGEKWAIVLLQQTSVTTIDAPLRRFEYTAPKTLSQDTATIRWLDDAGGLFGSPLTIFDPDFRFHGRATSYLPGEGGFRGVALQRKDLAAVEADRWEIVQSEGFATWAVVECYTATPVPLFTLNSYGGGPWDHRAPAEIGAAIVAAVPADMLSQLAPGRRFYAQLAAADTSPPSYVIVAARTGGSGSAGELVTIYIDHNIPKAVQAGSSFTPGKTNVERYELNGATGKYERGDNIEIENHDSAEGLIVPTGKPYRGFASKNEYGKYVVHVVLCKPIPQTNG